MLLRPHGRRATSGTEELSRPLIPQPAAQRARRGSVAGKSRHLRASTAWFAGSGGPWKVWRAAGILWSATARARLLHAPPLPPGACYSVAPVRTEGKGAPQLKTLGTGLCAGYRWRLRRRLAASLTSPAG